MYYFHMQWWLHFAVLHLLALQCFNVLKFIALMSNKCSAVTGIEDFLFYSLATHTLTR